ncbi:unnamed protein product [Oppiella nova]|uniref:Uncharacterized protein n=1 Tax=Oppiella nova TaxID=334625 RepID=A0A7R9M8W7_9ACAR|nr:unnamed protein product [Oppiella nova]CAG2172966.1 unnamed protein product [Oppiella nova]
MNDCISSQSYDVLNYLLVNSLIDINAVVDQYGWNAFHKAVYNKDIDLIVLLIKYEIKINVVDINGNTPFHILFQSTTHQLTTDRKTFADFGPENHYSIVILKLMLYYCKSQNIHIINERNLFGKTALHYAVVNIGSVDTMLSLISLMMESGCNPDSRDRLNRTPLFCLFNEQSICERNKRLLGVIVAQFFGHTHYDEFRVYYSNSDCNKVTGFALISPSVTPYDATVKLNPAYRIIKCKDNGIIQDIETYTLDLRRANSLNELSPDWNFEYSMANDYSMQFIVARVHFNTITNNY